MEILSEINLQSKQNFGTYFNYKPTENFDIEMPVSSCSIKLKMKKRWHVFISAYKPENP